MNQPAVIPVPYGLTAELTHRCPLHCVYCSNSLELAPAQKELPSEDWLRTIEQAHALGVVQFHFSGGEPLVRPDLEIMVRRASELDFYTNLITSGAGLTRERMGALAAAGLHSVQLSLQASGPALNDRIAGRKSFEEKREAAGIIRSAGVPLSMNVVLHRLNLDATEDIIDLCAAWGAERLELANTQYHGWALLNRAQLLPTREQVQRAETVCRRKRAELKDRMEIIWVLPDYYEDFPKPCMGGWGQVQLTVCPDGTALPCQAAGTIKSLVFENVRHRDLGWIWRESFGFNAFRGFDWMPQPCRSCDRRFQDFGGCRCQAFALTSDAARTDPVCQWAPDHRLVKAAVMRANQPASDTGPMPAGDVFHRMTYRRSP